MTNLLQPFSSMPPKVDNTPEGFLHQASAASQQQGGWRRLAARIAQWTTRGLLCGIVLAACVGFGRQILQWWYENPPEEGKSLLLADPLAGLGDEERLHVFRFRDLPWEFRRQVIRGDARKAFDRLKAECVQATANYQASPPPPAGQEKRFLETLQHRSSVAQGAGWKVYAFHESLPLVVGIRENDQGGKSPSTEGQSSIKKDAEKIPPQQGECPENIPSSILDNHTTKRDHPPKKSSLEPLPATPDVVSIIRTVVCWGFGLPLGENRWSLYILIPDSSGKTSNLGGREVIPIPPETHLLYSLGVIQGGWITFFQGPPRPETWKLFYETFFRTHGGQQIGPWIQQANRWQGRFQWDTETPPASSPHSRSKKIVEIYFGPDTSDTWNGLIWIWAQGPEAPLDTGFPK